LTHLEARRSQPHSKTFEQAALEHKKQQSLGTDPLRQFNFEKKPNRRDQNQSKYRA